MKHFLSTLAWLVCRAIAPLQRALAWACAAIFITGWFGGKAAWLGAVEAGDALAVAAEGTVVILGWFGRFRKVAIPFVACLFIVGLLAVPQQGVFNVSGLNGTVTATGSPWNSLGNWHMDFRLTNWTNPGGGAGTRTQVFSINAGGIIFYVYSQGSGNVTFHATDGAEGIATEASLNPFPVATYGRDFVARFHHNATAGKIYMEVWDVSGGNYNCGYQSGCGAVISSPQTNMSGAIQMGDPSNAAGTVAFVRWFSSDVPLNSTPPYGAAPGASSIGDWEFSGTTPISTIADASGNSLNLTMSSALTVSSAPTYNPGCSASLTSGYSTFVLGASVSTITGANSIPLNGANVLTYAWAAALEQTPFTGQANPATISFSSTTNVNPTITGATAPGSYTVSLTCSDNSTPTPLSTTAYYKFGIVQTNSNGTAVISNPNHATILGPLQPITTSPWPSYEQQGINFTQLIITKLQALNVLYGPQSGNVTDYYNLPAPWNVASAGTVTASHTTPQIVGSGTTFTTTFCQGATGNPTVPKQIEGANPFIAIWYVIAQGSGNVPLSAYPANTTGRKFYSVHDCVDDTHLNLCAFDNCGGTTNYNQYSDPATQDGSGLSYSYMDNGNGVSGYGIGMWIAGNSPGNYYDNVRALYAEFYRTQIDDYLYWAEDMAFAWFSGPLIDKGVNWNHYNSTYQGSYRAMSVEGLQLYALDTAHAPPYPLWPGLSIISNELINGNGSLGLSDCRNVGPSITGCFSDVREQSYADRVLAVDSKFTTVSGQALLDTNALAADITNRWAPDRQSGGNFNMSDTSAYASYTNGPPSVTVTVGSTTVTATSGSFSSYCGIVTNGINSACSPPFSATNYPAGIWFFPVGTLVNSANSAQVAPISSFTTTGGNAVFTLVGTAPGWLTTSSSVLINGIAGGAGCAINPQVSSGLGNPSTTYTPSSVSGSTVQINSLSTANCLMAQQTWANNQGDTNWYYAYCDSSCQAGTGGLKLIDVNGTPKPYVADFSCPSGSCTVGYEVSGLLGAGTQPFMVGIQTGAQYMMSLALATSNPTQANLMASWALGNAQWMASTGLNTQTYGSSNINGLYYGRGFVSCEPPTSANPFCDSGLNGDRELNGEGMNVATYALRLNPTSAATKALGYTMMNALWSWNPGDPGYDTYAPASDIQATTGYFYNGTGQSKWTGYYWGIGANWSFSAVVAGLTSSGSILPSGILGGGVIANEAMISEKDVRRVLGIRRYF